ncbi:hypothetical protein CR513_15672, partial [Mucuna pruriens]
MIHCFNIYFYSNYNLEEGVIHSTTAVPNTIFPRITRVTSVKEMWNTLLEEFQGNTKVCTINIQTLQCEFELIKMKKFEIIKDCYFKIKEIVTQMRAYRENIIGTILSFFILDYIKEPQVRKEDKENMNTRALQGPMTTSRMKRLQVEVLKKIGLLKSLEEHAQNLIIYSI